MAANLQAICPRMPRVVTIMSTFPFEFCRKYCRLTVPIETKHDNSAFEREGNCEGNTVDGESEAKTVGMPPRQDSNGNNSL